MRLFSRSKGEALDSDPEEDFPEDEEEDEPEDEGDSTTPTRGHHDAHHEEPHEERVPPASPYPSDLDPLAIRQGGRARHGRGASTS